MSKLRCYIAGPIARNPNYLEDFAKANKAVIDMGYEAVNPLDVEPHTHEGECPPGYSPGEGEHEHTSSACYMRSDLKALLDCDAIYLIPGWAESRGARVEWQVAQACGMKMLGEEPTPDWFTR